MRREDQRFLTGTGRYCSDALTDDTLHASFLRSDRAHALIKSITVDDARAMPGVQCVLTGVDLRQERLGEFPLAVPSGRIVKPLDVPPRTALAVDCVVYVGEPVAIVVAKTLAQVQDALEVIEVDYKDLSAVTDPALATRECLVLEHGDSALVQQAFDRAAHRVSLELRMNRVVGHPIEPRAAIARFDYASARFTLRVGHQGAQSMRAQLAQVMNVASDQIWIETPDIGGAFGVKEPVYAEYVALLVAARQLQRPIAWLSTRSEAFLSEYHARDVVQRAELAIGTDGCFLAMRFEFRSNLGAHIAKAGAFIATFNPGRSMAGIYDVGAIHGTVYGLVTNTPPVGPYRGAGRPEMAFAIERLVDEAAAQVGIDRIELRRRNAVRTFPHTTAHGVIYESGNFASVLERALEAANWSTIVGRREQARSRNRLRGIGLASFVEATGGPLEEGVALRFSAEGSIEILAATQSSGQAHETVFPLIAARLLGVPEGVISLSQGLHDAPGASPRSATLAGGSTIASRSLTATSGAIKAACDESIAKARLAAAAKFEVADADVSFEAGIFRVVGTDRAVTLIALAAEVTQTAGHSHPFDSQSRVAAVRTFPNGCHVAEIEIDPETGVIELVAFTAVDDFGIVQHAGIVEAQVHGGVTQGIGQALLEHCRYDADTGQLLTGSLMDYALPRADDLPLFCVIDAPTTSTAHPLGAKGAGESGSTGAPAAIANAVADALRQTSATVPDMPFTAEKIWRALRAAKR